MGAEGQGARTKKGGGGEQASGSRGYSKNVAVPLIRLSGGMVKNPQCALKGTYRTDPNSRLFSNSSLFHIEAYF